MVEKKKAKKPQDIVPLMLRLREALRLRLFKDAEKAAKSLNAEIVDRLEASYAKDERIEELRARLDEVRPSIDEARAAFEKDRDRLDAEAKQRKREIEDLRVHIRTESAKFQAEITALEAEVAMHQTAEAIFETFMGDDVASKEAARGVAVLLAANPGWAANAESVQKMVRAAGAAIAQAANRGRTSVTGAVSTTPNPPVRLERQHGINQIAQSSIRDQ